MTWEVLVAPADALARITGEGSTVPAPLGGWGVPAVSEDGSEIAFGCPIEHITPALRAAWPQVQNTARTRTATIRTYDRWTEGTTFERTRTAEPTEERVR